MARKAYPGLSREAQEQLAIDALMRAVEHELRIQCTMKECKSLDDAVAVMLRYEAVQQIYPEEGKNVIKMVTPSQAEACKEEEGGMPKQMEESCKKMDSLLEKQIKAIGDVKYTRVQTHEKNMRSRGSQGGWQRAGKDECFHCGQKGHFIRDCPQRTSRWSTEGNTNPPDQ